MEKICLINKYCRHCHGDISSLNENEKKTLLSQLSPAWQLNAKGHLNKKFAFKNFISAMKFANKIADIAEQEKHHPNLTIGWGFCKVRIWTNSINDLTENDFILAAKIDNAFS